MESADLPLRPAAEYVRMSTDEQVYSIENQREAIRSYAERHGLQIVRTFTDEGRSGLTFNKRPGLQSLLAQVVSGTADFGVLLVYDISRWGRFQDVDESAHYEYLCRRAGVRVVYCAEPFLNEPSGFASAMKGVKRAMAAEYSRELSDKVFAGQCRLVGLGFRQGGPPGLGFRRRLVDATGADKGLLHPGEQKSIQSDRVVLVLGPEEEIDLVRRIFRLFVREGLGEQAIANVLNGEGLKTDRGRCWGSGTVHDLLTNEKYAGTALFGRTCGRLHARRRRLEPDHWLRVAGAHPAIVEADVFLAAQRRIADRQVKLTDSAVLEALRRVWKKHGTITGRLIERTRGAPKACLYKARFGGLLKAYRLIGFQPQRTYESRMGRPELRRMSARLTTDLALRLEQAGARVRLDRNLLDIDGVRVAIQLVTPKRLHGKLRWVPWREKQGVDLLALVRMPQNLAAPLDVFLLPYPLHAQALSLGEEPGSLLELFRFADLTVIEEVVPCTAPGRATVTSRAPTSETRSPI